MQERVKTSFIPKASLEVEREHHATSNPVALANIVTGALLILTILASAGIYLFERYTAQNIVSKQATLERSRAAFEPATIKELYRLNVRIESGKKLLEHHVALSHLFDDLEGRTLSTVRFNEFTYAETNPGRILLTMSGAARSFNTVALQSQEFSKSTIVTEPRFTNVNIDKDGSIRFDFTGTIDATRQKYTGSASAESEGDIDELQGTDGKLSQ
jgi:hypothetical protein